MARFFTRRTPAAVPTPGAAGTRLASAEDTRCTSYAPGHQIHYIHQGQALRSPSVPARNVIVDGHRVIVLTADGSQTDFSHHDPERLGTVLGLFANARVLYPRFHALRVGPYWFNLADADFSPCDPGAEP